ncbi:hypothetical protein BGZ76_006289 [Entomortierella beljakovae]|nr:hypothetical protein BGZ76_006289 [Entomortierella beljakovae]
MLFSTSKLILATVAVIAAMSTADAAVNQICYKDCMLNGYKNHSKCVSACGELNQICFKDCMLNGYKNYDKCKAVCTK